MAQLTVGLDLGSESIKRVRLSSSFRTVEVVDFTTVPIPKDDRPRAARLAEALSQLQTTSNPHDLVATTLPGDEVSTRVITLPFTDKRTIERVLGGELESQIPFALETVVYDHLVAGAAPDGGSRLLTAVCQRDKMTGWMDIFKTASLEPRFVGPDCASYASLFQFLEPPAEQGAVAVLDIGQRLTSLCIVGPQGPEFCRTLSSGGADLTAQLAETFKINPAQAEELKRSRGFFATTANAPADPTQAQISDALRRALSALVREVRQTLATHQTLFGHPVAKLWLCGGGAAVSNLDTYLTEQLDRPVERIQPGHFDLPGMDGLVQASASPADWVKPLALALHAHQTGRRGFLNLRRGDFSFQGDYSFFRTKITQIAVALLILLLLAIGYTITRYISLSKFDKKLDERAREISQSILKKAEDNLDVAISKIKEKISPEADPLPRVSALEVLQELHSRVPEGLKFKLKDLDISPKKVQLSGLVDSFESVEKLKTAYAQYKCFTSVQTGKTQKTHDGADVEFQFTIAFGC